MSTKSLIHCYVSGDLLGVVNSPTFQTIMFDRFFERIVERGNRYAATKLPPYTREYTDSQYETLYANWINYVKTTVDPDKLLVFNVKEGIDPLVDFCQVEKPSWKMPNRNDSERFGKLILILKFLTYVLYSIILLFLYGLQTQNHTIIAVSLTLFCLWTIRNRIKRALNFDKVEFDREEFNKKK